MGTETKNIKRDRAALENQLKAMGARFKGKACTCPFHEDGHPSASISELESGWWFKCHVPTCGWAGDVIDVMAHRAKNTPADIIRELEHIQPRPDARPKRVFSDVAAIVASVGHIGVVEATYTYCDTQGIAQVVQVRYRSEGRKQFLVHRAVDGGFVLGAPPKPWPIYNRARVLASPVVVVVEGEKCVHALHSIGIVATTSLSGSGNADKADWTPLAGKRVCIWRDKDAAGLKYAETVIAELDKLEPKPDVSLMNVEELSLLDGGDAADFIVDGVTADEVWTTIREVSSPVGSGRELSQRMDDIRTGKWASIRWPFKFMARSVRSLYPGTWTMIGGDPSATKSMFVLQAFNHWHQNGIKVALKELEDDKAFHLHRLLALLCGRWDMLNEDWCKANAEEVAALQTQHEPAIKSFASCMSDVHAGDVNYMTLLKWIRKSCEQGCRVIGIDPITSVDVERPYAEDKIFIRQSCEILKEFGASLICVTHPRSVKNYKQVTQDDLAGARAFSRHVQAILWLNRHDPSKMFKVKDSDGLETEVWCNRTLRVLKARMSPGLGMRFGFNMGSDVKFAEAGMIVKDLKRSVDDAPSELDSLF